MDKLYMVCCSLAMWTAIAKLCSVRWYCKAWPVLAPIFWALIIPPCFAPASSLPPVLSGTLDINSVVRSFAAVTAASNGAATPLQANHASLASPAPLILNRSTSAAAAAAAAAAAGTPRSPAAAAAAAAAAEAAMAAAAAEGESPVQGLVPQHLLMSHSSHISSTSEQGAAASMVLNAANGLATGGVGAGADANCLGSPIPSVAAAALVGLAGGAGQQGFGGLADAPWGWGMEGGMGGAPQVGPSCITTGME